MINVKSDIYNALLAVTGNVNDTYPHEWKTFPQIQYVEEENNIYEWTDGHEQSSLVRYRIDIWDNISTSDWALCVDLKLSELGLKRSQCMDIDDESGYKHKQMRYVGIIDVHTRFVNQI